MSYYKEVLQEELNRSLRGQKLFKERMQELRHGYISVKKIKNHEYVYLQYRQDKKLKSEYQGVKTDELIEQLQEENNKYLEFKAALSNARKEEIKLRKAINVL